MSKDFKFNPRIKPHPDGHLEVEVDIPEDENGNENPDDIFAAMQEAARFAFPDMFDANGDPK